MGLPVRRIAWSIKGQVCTVVQMHMLSLVSLDFSQHGSKVVIDAACRYERCCALRCLQKNEGDAGTEAVAGQRTH